MPTISQLPTVSSVSAADLIPISQSGTAYSALVGTVLQSTQPAINIASATLLGRTSIGPGGPEQVAIGAGLALSGTTLTATGVNLSSVPVIGSFDAAAEMLTTSGGSPALLPVTQLRNLFSAGPNVTISATGTISAAGGGTAVASQDLGATIGTMQVTTKLSSTDLLPVSQGGTGHAVSYANLIDGLTIDAALAAGTAADTDTFWVSQGGGLMVRQTLASLWTWLQGKFPTYVTPVIEVTANVTLQTALHNGRLLVCSQPVTISPEAVPSNGFSCRVLNASSGYVTFAAGFLSSSASMTLAPWETAFVQGVVFSGGSTSFVAMPDAGTASSTPGAVVGLTVTGETASTISLAWQAPTNASGTVTYTVLLRVSGTTAWTTALSGLTTLSAQIAALNASSSYDVAVQASNASGAGPLSTIVTVTTAAAVAAVTSITWNLPPTGPYTAGAGAIGVNAHVNPSTAAIQFGISTSSTVQPTSWIAASFVNTDLWGAYVPTPGTIGTYFMWAEGTDGSAPTVYATPFTVQ